MSQQKTRHLRIFVRYIKWLIIGLIILHIALTVFFTIQLVKTSKQNNANITIYDAMLVLEKVKLADAKNKIDLVLDKIKQDDRFNQFLISFTKVPVDDSYKVQTKYYLALKTFRNARSHLIKNKVIIFSEYLPSSQQWINVAARLDPTHFSFVSYHTLPLEIMFSLAVIVLLIISYFIFYRKLFFKQLIDTLKPNKKSNNDTSEELRSEIETLHKKIQEFVNEKTLMLSSLAHDINTPLMKVRLKLSMIDDTNEDLKSVQEDLDDIDDVIRSSLSLSSTESIQGTKKKFEFISLINKIIDPYLKSNPNVSFNCKESNLIYTGDPVLVKRTVCNMIENALKYASNVHIELSNKDNKPYMTIEDDGPGIPEEQMKDVLKPFQRIQKSQQTRKKRGVGLGLSIANKILTLHNGKLILENRQQGGLRVILKW